MAKPKQILSKREKELIAALFKEGKTDAEIAKVIGLQRETFRKVAKYNGLSCTIKETKEMSDEKVKRSLYERACGYECEEEATSIDKRTGELHKVSIVKRYLPDVAAAIFWLCNRQPKNWKNVQKIDASGLMDNFAAVVKAIRDKENGGKK